MKRVYNNSGGISWYVQRITGILILIFVSIHLYIMHLSGSPNQVWDWYSFLERFRDDPWMKVFYTLFLGTVLTHGLNGIWEIALDYINSRTTKVLVHAALWIIGIVFGTMGVLAIFVLVPKAF